MTETCHLAGRGSFSFDVCIALSSTPSNEICYSTDQVRVIADLHPVILYPNDDGTLLCFVSLTPEYDEQKPEWSTKEEQLR